MADVSLTTRLVDNPYADDPCTYLILDREAVFLKGFQEMMVALQKTPQGTS